MTKPATATMPAADWRSCAAYSALAGIDRAGLMWEWLRRDPGYRRHALAARRGRVSGTRVAEVEVVPAEPCWGCAFAEDPDRAAPVARILLSASVDPGVLRAEAVAAACESGGFDLRHLARLRITIARSATVEHLAIDDGRRRLRVDVVGGTLLEGPVRLRFLIDGSDGLDQSALTLRRLAALLRRGRLLPSLYPTDTRLARWTAALRVKDALTAGASHREIAIALHGIDHVAEHWGGRSDALQSRIRRAAALARRLAAGGYRDLLKI